MPSNRPTSVRVSVSSEQGSSPRDLSFDSRRDNPVGVQYRLAKASSLTDLSIDLRSADSFVEIDLRDPIAPLLATDEGLLGATPWQTRVKRSFDLSVACIALLVLSPLLLASALLISITSRGPILHKQIRVGELGRRFVFFKFRTMYVDAEERRDELASANEIDGPVFKIRCDPRITPVGRVLRRLSIDELPQLIHVITGEMSLVGPRPPLPSEVETYGWWELQRLLVKPGITCIWQVSGRSDLDFDTWVRMDLEYIRRWNPTLDLGLLARTVPAVLLGRGAY